MATANSGLQITNLDFGAIKSSLKTFLSQQDTLKDYNFDGSALSVLIDLMAYNTQYNAYYLNMVANEMFLDSAVQRGSVVSIAKLLGYTPNSYSAPKARIKLVVNEVSEATLTLPKNTEFLSESVDGVNYRFVTSDATTVSVTANTATFDNLEIAQGITSSYSYTVNTTSNPKLVFQIPDETVDLSTLVVTVQESSSNVTSETYTRATDYSSLNQNSKVYFVQENDKGFFEIYFGDGILGKSLIDGNLVLMSYVSTQGTSAFGANAFVLMSSVSGYSNTAITSISAATQGAEKESINSIKYTAPKSFAAQSRAVTKEDYIYLIQNNSTSIPVESVSVWGGEDNDPPVYGQLFCAVKPSGGFTLTPTQKQRLIEEVIKPISVLTITPTVVDPDYVYVSLDTTVLYNPKRTNNTASEIKEIAKAAALTFCKDTLNTFNSTFKLPELTRTVQASEPSIITNETKVRLEKKFYPSLTTKTTYQLNFGTKLNRNYFKSGLTTYPDITVQDINSSTRQRSGVYFEEVPQTSSGIQSINIINQGYGYTKVPTVTILGDGTGASAYAVLVGTRVNNIVITDPGFNYSQATVLITPADGDTSGTLAAAVAVVEGEEGTLRTYYYQNNSKVILNNAAGTINYNTGVVTLTDFAPIAINNELGQFVISVQPDSTIVSSAYNRIVAIDEFDPESIVVNVNASSQ